MNVAKYQAMHGVVGNAPSNAVMDATAMSGVPRLFYGSGSPTSALLAGNSRYNASQGGWVYNVALVAAGTGYAVGDTITLTGGTKTTAVIVTVDSVVSGVIQEWHVSQAGVFTVYPTAVATQGSTSGSGTGATFWLNTPPPDLYLDLTTITAPVLWICTVAGTAAGSTWQKVSGGGGGVQQFRIVKDIGDSWYCYTWDGTTLGTIGYVVIKPYKMRCGANAITSETIRLVTYGYSYALVTSGVDSANLYFVRSTTWAGPSSETCYPEPCPIITTTPANNEIITGVACTTNILSSIEQSVIGVAVASGGSGYSVGNTLTVVGGTLFSATGISFTAATIYVDAVASGVITACHIVNASCYSSLPANPVSVTGGGGSSATFNLTPCGQLLDTDNSREWAK